MAIGGGVQRRVILSFLAFLEDRGYVINTTKTNTELVDEYFVSKKLEHR